MPHIRREARVNDCECFFPYLRWSSVIIIVVDVLYRSMLLSKRNRDDESRAGFTKWPFMTTQSWAENPRGRWKLFVIFDSEEPQAGSLHEWSLLLHGTQQSPYVGQKVTKHTTSSEIVKFIGEKTAKSDRASWLKTCSGPMKWISVQNDLWSSQAINQSINPSICNF